MGCWAPAHPAISGVQILCRNTGLEGRGSVDFSSFLVLLCFLKVHGVNPIMQYMTGGVRRSLWHFVDGVGEQERETFVWGNSGECWAGWIQTFPVQVCGGGDPSCPQLRGLHQLPVS